MTPTSRPIVRATTRRIPDHALAAPGGAPFCYGDLRTRSAHRGCATCHLTTQCADRVDLLSHDLPIEDAPRPEGRTIIRIGEDAPMILNQHRCRVRVAIGRIAHVDDAWRRYIARQIDRDVDDRLARLAWDTAAGGLITVYAAIEFCSVADDFRIWLETSVTPRMEPARARVASEVWLTAAITRRALTWQGRLEAFRPGLHHEVWSELIDTPMSRSALRHRLIDADRRFINFATETAGMAVLPNAA